MSPISTNRHPFRLKPDEVGPEWHQIAVVFFVTQHSCGIVCSIILIFPIYLTTHRHTYAPVSSLLLILALASSFLVRPQHCIPLVRTGNGVCGTEGGRCQPYLATDTLLKVKLFYTQNNFHPLPQDWVSRSVVPPSGQSVNVNAEIASCHSLPFFLFFLSLFHILPECPAA